MADMWACKTHRTNNGGKCLSCDAAMRWNLCGKRCDCGDVAIGYVMQAKDNVSFYCAAHFDIAASKLSEVTL